MPLANQATLNAPRGPWHGAKRAFQGNQKVALGTVRRMEGFGGTVGARTETLGRVVAVLEKAGVEFLDGERPGVRMGRNRVIG